jgi:hypothetical protein
MRITSISQLSDAAKKRLADSIAKQEARKATTTPQSDFKPSADTKVDSKTIESVKSGLTENQIQKQILDYLEKDNRVAWHARNNTGATKTDNRFIRFGFKGDSDIKGQMQTGQYLAIEVKKPKPKKTYANKDQKAFLTKVFENGGVSGVARSVEDVIRILAGEFLL